MYVYQVKFKDALKTPHNIAYGGIRVIDGESRKNYVICGCCGSVLEEGEYEILEEYKTWMDVSQEIMGEV